MALGLTTTSDSADRLPIMKYDARAGRFFKIDRVQGASGWESLQEDVTNNLTVAIDLHDIDVGWIAFTTQGPDFKVVKIGQGIPARPTDQHKQGFRVKLYEKNLGVREFASTAKVVVGAIDALHSTVVETVEYKAGQIPVIKMTGTLPVTTSGPQGKTTNYAPVFELLKFIPRPEALPLDAPVKAMTVNFAPTAATAPAAAHVAPPPPVTAAPAASEAEF